MLGPACELVSIEPNINYTKLNDNLIFSLHCIKTNKDPVKIYPISGETVIFPPGSFIQGAVYHIYLKKMEFNPDTAGFIGYKMINTKK